MNDIRLIVMFECGATIPLCLLIVLFRCLFWLSFLFVWKKTTSQIFVFAFIIVGC